MSRSIAIIALLMALTGTHLFAAGEVADGKISAYLVGKLQKEELVRQQLEKAGFEIVSSSKVDKRGKIRTLIFTSDTLKKTANKQNRGFAAILRVAINKVDNEIRISNPLYFQKAFLQKAYNESAAKKLLVSLNQAFPELKDSKDKLEYNGIEKFHFMMGMPYYEEMETVGEASSDSLLKNLKAYKGGKNLLFTLRLDKARVLVGYQLGKRTSKFIKKIGTKNALLLPYTILIEDTKAKILAPKYYMALSYPALTMSEFMTIATIPGAIQKECTKPFK